MALSNASTIASCFFVLICLWESVASLFACDSGNLTSICVISGPHYIANQSFSVSGNSLVFSQNGSLYCYSQQCSIQVDMENEVSILGKIYAGQIQISSPLVSIGEMGLLSVTGGGYGPGLGPGAGGNESAGIAASGGSYGGYAMPQLSNLGLPYGSFSEPMDFGSGGGVSGDDVGGAGGGIIMVQAVNLTVDGQIIANGASGQNYSGGGSGGSIYLNATSIEGSGQLYARGGGSRLGGLGSGGRIAINHQNTTQPLQLVLYADGYANDNYIQAGAGTIYFAANDTLLIDNLLTYVMTSLEYTGGTPIDGTYVSTIVAQNSGIIIPTENTVNCSYLSLLDCAALACVACQDDWSLNAREAIEIGTCSFLNLSGWWDIASSSIMLDGTIYGHGLSLTADNLTIHGSVITSGGGLGPALGPGAGESGVGDQPGSGAGHGNVGMSACIGAATGGAAYDSDVLPSDYGSGGGNAGPLLGGVGGGIIVITATNMTFAGSLSANGLAGASGTNYSFPYGAGGGSGGSISIQCERLTAMTLSIIQANGGAGGWSYSGGYGGGGAGGRIYFNLGNVEILRASEVSIKASGGTTECIDYRNDGTIVSQCPPGYSSDGLSFICQPCAAGQYSPNGGVCQPCPAGTSTNGFQAQKNCTECAPGFYSQYPGNSLCFSCPAGSFTNEPGQAECDLCPPGYSNEYEAQTNCTACPPGTMHGDTIFPSPCVQCSAGYYSNQSAQAECTPCPSGYASTTNFTGCVACGPGFYSAGYECASCYSGYYSNATANVECTMCLQGTYQDLYDGTTCYPCAVGSSSFLAASHCYPCYPGTYNNISGGECYSCPPFTYQPDSGQTKCLPCGNPIEGSAGCQWGSSDSGDPDKPLFAIFVALPLFLVSILALAAYCSYRRRMRRRQEYQRIEDRPTPQIPPIPPPLPVSINDSPSEPVEKECIICCDKPKDTVLLPCGHIASCETCTRALLVSKPLCPCCRKTILSFVLV